MTYNGGGGVIDTTVPKHTSAGYRLAGCVALFAKRKNFSAVVRVGYVHFGKKNEEKVGIKRPPTDFYLYNRFAQQSSGSSKYDGRRGNGREFSEIRKHLSKK